MNSSTQSIQVNLPCQICGKQSNYICFDCKKANYCTKQHQKQHWKSGHKDQCELSRASQHKKKSEIQRHITQARKNYYDNYSNKIFNQCLLDAKLMTGLSKQYLSIDNSIKQKLQYGGSVCLLVRTFHILGDNSSAKYQMDNYLKSSKEFLYQIERYKQMLSTKSILKDEQKQQLQMKLNLISGIANLCYVIGMNTTQYYVLYTKYVISCFGEESFEASNCYFLVGCYFSEEGWFNKAIACFEKAAKIRGQFAGDCMFNIGVLYKLMKNLPKALQTLDIAIKLREQQYGEDSNQVAEVNQLLGSIYTELNDYKTALIEYEKAFRVRSTNILTPEYENILDLIHELYNKLYLYIKVGQPNMKRPEIYTHLLQEIAGDSTYWQNQKYKKRGNQDDDILPIITEKDDKEKVDKFNKKKKIVATEEPTKFSWKDSGLFTISQEFVAGLNLSELFRLSEMQLELQLCESIFNLVYIVGTSVFFESLRQEKKRQLEDLNPRLFQLMRMEDIKQIKHKDK